MLQKHTDNEQEHWHLTALQTRLCLLNFALIYDHSVSGNHAHKHHCLYVWVKLCAERWPVVLTWNHGNSLAYLRLDDAPSFQWWFPNGSQTMTNLNKLHHFRRAAGSWWSERAKGEIDRDHFQQKGNCCSLAFVNDQSENWFTYMISCTLLEWLGACVLSCAHRKQGQSLLDSLWSGIKIEKCQLTRFRQVHVEDISRWRFDSGNCSRRVRHKNSNFVDEVTAERSADYLIGVLQAVYSMNDVKVNPDSRVWLLVGHRVDDLFLKATVTCCFELYRRRTRKPIHLKITCLKLARRLWNSKARR